MGVAGDAAEEVRKFWTVGGAGEEDFHEFWEDGFREPFRPVRSFFAGGKNGAQRAVIVGDGCPCGSGIFVKILSLIEKHFRVATGIAIDGCPVFFVDFHQLFELVVGGFRDKGRPPFHGPFQLRLFRPHRLDRAVRDENHFVEGIDEKFSFGEVVFYLGGDFGGREGEFQFAGKVRLVFVFLDRGLDFDFCGVGRAVARNKGRSLNEIDGAFSESRAFDFRVIDLESGAAESAESGTFGFDVRRKDESFWGECGFIDGDGSRFSLRAWGVSDHGHFHFCGGFCVGRNCDGEF